MKNSMKKYRKLSLMMILAILSIMLIGCAKKEVTTDTSTTEINEPTQGIAVGEPNPSAKMTAEAVDKINAEKAIKDVSTIELFDIEGNTVDKTFTPEEVAAIVTAYNDSMIQDTSYIEMITGNTMVITLADSSTIRITSYGDENNVVASTSDGRSYHLACTEIATILLSK